MIRYYLILIGFLWAWSVSLADSLVVPAGLESTFGNTFADPFFGTVNSRVVQVYGASEFAGASSDSIIITRVAFRIDQNEAGSLDAVVPRITLGMATFAGTLAEVNAGIYGYPVQTVYDAENVHLTATPDSPERFNVSFNLQNPFIYDRRDGALVLNFKSQMENGFVRGMDAQFPGNGVLVRDEPFSRTVVEPRLIVTQFSYTNIPEPRSSLFWTTICLSLGVSCLIKKNTLPIEQRLSYLRSCDLCAGIFGAGCVKGV